MEPDPTLSPPSDPLTPDRVLRVQAPDRQTVPLVFASAHSGRAYPADFVAASRLDPQTLRRSEDSFVDDLFKGVVDHGAPLLSALFPRAYCDANREPCELDPAMFSDALPQTANTRSPRVLAGLGTIPRVVSSGAEIHAGRLTVADAERRIAQCYHPYHRRLRSLLDDTIAAFGWVLLVDCHSMPSVGGPMDNDTGQPRVDVVLGDCFSASCAPSITLAAETAFTELGYRVVRNTPYAGGYVTRHYGRPRQGCHAIQIELNRALYMDEAAHRPTPGFESLRRDLDRVVAALVRTAHEGRPR
jgi:N-formylglutamate amidohydrolase